MPPRIRIELPRKLHFQKPIRLGLCSGQAFFPPIQLCNDDFSNIRLADMRFTLCLQKLILLSSLAVGAAATTCHGYARDLQQPVDEDHLHDLGMEMPYSHSTS